MRTHTLLAALAATTLLQAGAALAQPGSPPASPGASAPAPGFRPGGGPRGPMGRFGSDYTPGWAMMTPQERDAHRASMHGAKTADECRQLVEEHRKLMEQRARERGMGNFRGPRRDACANWRN
ncbi:MAG: hypothetical protein ACO1PB_19670 [Ramlibacter sp.]